VGGTFVPDGSGAYSSVIERLGELASSHRVEASSRRFPKPKAAGSTPSSAPIKSLLMQALFLCVRRAQSVI